MFRTIDTDLVKTAELSSFLGFNPDSHFTISLNPV